MDNKFIKSVYKNIFSWESLLKVILGTIAMFIMAFILYFFSEVYVIYNDYLILTITLAVGSATWIIFYLGIRKIYEIYSKWKIHKITEPEIKELLGKYSSNSEVLKNIIVAESRGPNILQKFVLGLFNFILIIMLAMIAIILLDSEPKPLSIIFSPISGAFLILLLIIIIVLFRYPKHRF